MRRLHCTVVLLLLTALAAPARDAAGQTPVQVPLQTPLQVPAGAAEFMVFLRGAAVGTVEVAVEKSATAIIVSGVSRLGPPLTITVRQAEIRYDPDWKPVEFTFDAMVRNELVRMHTEFANGTATSEVTYAINTTTKSDPVAADTVVLPNAFFGAYEALAARLMLATPGAEFRAYVVPQAEIAVRVNTIADERIKTPERSIAARHFGITLVNPGAPLDADLWADMNGRLLRFSVPAQSLDVARSDIATVAARRETVTRPGDQNVSIPASGFTLAATLSIPTTASARPSAKRPAVVLVAGSGPTDRDETVAGIPIFAQVAAALADAGFLVVRYDKRGVGQSGGRIDSATLADYAEDIRAAVNYLWNQKNVDRKAIAVVGHSEGGWTTLLAAANNKRIAAVGLIAAAGTTGAEVILEQQQHALERSAMPAAEKQAKVELQKKLQAAVMTGKGWEGIPTELRSQADTPWFQSFLLFDPAKAMRRVKQPILVLQGTLDRQVPADEAEKLASLARSRKPPAGGAVQVRTIAGLNHLLVPATTGEVEEYGSLPDKTVSRELLAALIAWLNDTLTRAAR